MEIATRAFATLTLGLVVLFASSNWWHVPETPRTVAKDLHRRARGPPAPMVLLSCGAIRDISGDCGFGDPPVVADLRLLGSGTPRPGTPCDLVLCVTFRRPCSTARVQFHVGASKILEGTALRTVAMRGPPASFECRIRIVPPDDNRYCALTAYVSLPDTEGQLHVRYDSGLPPFLVNPLGRTPDGRYPVLGLRSEDLIPVSDGPPREGFRFYNWNPEAPGFDVWEFREGRATLLGISPAAEAPPDAWRPFEGYAYRPDDPPGIFR